MFLSLISCTFFFSLSLSLSLSRRTMTFSTIRTWIWSKVHISFLRTQRHYFYCSILSYWTEHGLKNPFHLTKYSSDRAPHFLLSFFSLCTTGYFQTNCIIIERELVNSRFVFIFTRRLRRKIFKKLRTLNALFHS